MSYRCCVDGCDNTSDKYSSKGTYYDGKYIRFPDKTEKRNIWNSIIGSTTDVKKYICSEHFTDDDWRVQDVIMNVPLSKRKIKADAVPSRKLPNTGGMKRATENVYGMDEETRKRLVADAFAAYEQTDLTIEISNGIAKKTRSRYKKKPKLKACSLEQSVEEVEIPVVDSNFVYNHTRKCGEITVHVNDATFTINCFLCSAICLEFSTFAKHIQTQHPSLLKKDVENPLDLSASDPGTFAVQESVKIANNPNVDIIKRVNLNTVSNDSVSSVEVKSEKNMSGLWWDNQSFLSQVIYLWKQNPVIWDKTHPYHMVYRKRKAAIIGLIDSLGKTYPNMTLTYRNIVYLLTRLRVTYRHEVKLQRDAEEKGQEYVPSIWFFEKLAFLGGDNFGLSLNQKVESWRRKIDQYPLDILDESQTNETEIQTLEIVELYEQQPILWNINHLQYRGKLQNKSSLRSLFSVIEKKYSNVKAKTEEEFMESLKRMHQWYSAHKYIRLHYEQMNKPFQSPYKNISEALKFLHGHVPPFRCDICGNVFHLESAYLRHTRHKSKCTSIVNTIVHECEYCRKRFASAPRLKRHLRMHTNERPYVCAMCGKAFRNYTTWFRHGRTHNQIKPFKCGECQRAYYTASMLRIHQKVHLGIRDKVCDVCGKTFTNAKYLYRHREVHLDHPKYECRNCGKNFKQYTNMFIHRKRCTVKGVSKSGREPLKGNNLQLLRNGEKSQTHNHNNQVKTIVKIDSNGINVCDTVVQAHNTDSLVKEESFNITEVISSILVQ